MTKHWVGELKANWEKMKTNCTEKAELLREEMENVTLEVIGKKEGIKI